MFIYDSRVACEANVSSTNRPFKENCEEIFRCNLSSLGYIFSGVLHACIRRVCPQGWRKKEVPLISAIFLLRRSRAPNRYLWFNYRKLLFRSFSCVWRRHKSLTSDNMCAKLKITYRILKFTRILMLNKVLKKLISKILFFFSLVLEKVDLWRFANFVAIIHVEYSPSGGNFLNSLINYTPSERKQKCRLWRPDAVGARRVPCYLPPWRRNSRGEFWHKFLLYMSKKITNKTLKQI